MDVDNVTSSDSSAEEDDLAGLKGYQFEPKRQRLEQEPGSTSESEDSTDGGRQSGEQETADRTENTAWCLCGCCAVKRLKREQECICCQENATSKSKSTPSYTGDITVCVTNNGDINLLLNPIFLENVLTGLNNMRGVRWQVNPSDNRGLRYAAYRQYTWWINKKLCPRRRRFIPACVTHTIRHRFPKLDEEEYEGFHSGDEDST